MNQHTSTRRRLFNQHDVHAAGLTDTLPELDDAGEGVDDEKASPRGPSHKQAAVIRSKIESAVNGAAGDNGRSVFEGVKVKNACGMAFTKSGRLYIASRSENNILKFNSDFKLMKFECKLADNPEFLLHV